MAKLYTVASSKPIIGLGIYGPLSTPTPMVYNDVLEMVTHKYDVYEVNPADYTEKVKVTISNINTITFKNSRAVSLRNRKRNREIQEMSKPVVVSTVKTETEQVVVTKQNDKNKKEDNKNNKSEVKVSTPDAFKK